MAKQYTENLSAKLQNSNQILLFPGLAQSDSEQPGPGATLLGWPNSIYFLIISSLNRQKLLSLSSRGLNYRLYF